MAIINHESCEVQFKIVYCGPALSGKTTNIAHVHSRLDQASRGDLVSIATSADRTLFFDFLPVKAMVINGYSTKFQLYTVPGQVVYNATRQLVMRGADGIVFVADSAWDRMKDNVESFANLQANLRENGRSFQDTPVVLQYNKRDQPEVAPLNYLEYTLNNRAIRLPSFESSAGTGHNVFATLDAVSQQVLHRFHEHTINRNQPPAAPAPQPLPAGAGNEPAAPATHPSRPAATPAAITRAGRLHAPAGDRHTAPAMTR